jgi:hypothetical protein
MFGTLVVALLVLQSPALQQPATESERDRTLRQLLERVQQLEAEVQELKAQRVAAPAPAEPARQPQPPPAQATPSSGAGAADASGMQMPGMSPAAAGEYPNLQFRGFSDVSYAANDQGTGANTFALGQFNLFITSTLSDHMGVVAEPVLEADLHNAFGFELERLLLQITANQYFSVSVGRYHTAIGWYSTAYHHSAWLQTAIGRPFLFEFEDKGGILPIHNVGISANGRIPSGRLRLRWVFEAGNGRASRTRFDEPTQNVVDENRGKAVNLAILARPDWWRGFEAGFSVYHDDLTPFGLPHIGQTILAAHAIYQVPVFEWLNEVVVIRNATHGSPQIDYTPAFYTQVSRAFGKIRPYFRYQYVNVPETDVYFSDVGLMYGPSVGVRYDLNQFSALKLQYDRTDRRDAPGFNAVATQLSFVF